MKLRRTVSEVVRPASTPPIIASGIKDDDDEDRIIAELEVSAAVTKSIRALPAQDDLHNMECVLFIKIRGYEELQLRGKNKGGGRSINT